MVDKDYYPGKGCNCAAWNEGECGCNADWTPKEIYELRAEVAALKAEIRKLRNGNNVYFDENTLEKGNE